MSWILKVNNLSKVYRVGTGATQHGTLFEQISKKIKKITSRNKSSINNIDDLEQSTAKAVVSAEQTEGLPPGYFWALKDINFQINPGERIGLIGQNGSGKSTLLKILSRITTPSHGEFRYRGHLISLLEVGTGFHPELSGRENIYLNAAINGLTRQQINSIFKSIVEFSELGTQIDTPVKRYSSGMYMRLAFSVAAFLESEILLIDEVLAVGDKDFQKKCKEKMLEVANDGRSVIFVSHDMAAIESICKKTIEISHGRVIEVKDIILSNHVPAEQARIELLPGIIATEVESLKKVILCAQQNWENDSINAPQIKDIIQLRSLRLLNDVNEIQEKFTVNENVNIEIKFRVLKNNSSLNVRVDLSSLSGVKLFTAMDHAAVVKNSVRENGLYSETVTIPKEYLNEGQFVLSVILTVKDDEQNEIKCLECLSMKIIDDQLPVGARASWTGAWPEGLLRPKLVWKTEHTQTQDYIKTKIKPLIEEK